MRKLAAIVVAAGVGLSMSACATIDQQWKAGCVVDSKTMVYDSGSDGGSKRVKRVDTSCGSFNVEDAWEAGVFSSWDLWAKLKEGHTYDIKVGGIRNGFFSSFQTVIDLKEVKGGPA